MLRLSVVRANVQQGKARSRHERVARKYAYAQPGLCCYRQQEQRKKLRAPTTKRDVSSDPSYAAALSNTYNTTLLIQMEDPIWSLWDVRQRQGRRTCELNSRGSSRRNPASIERAAQSTSALYWLKSVMLPSHCEQDSEFTTTTFDVSHGPTQPLTES